MAFIHTINNNLLTLTQREMLTNHLVLNIEANVLDIHQKRVNYIYSILYSLCMTSKKRICPWTI